MKLSLKRILSMALLLCLLISACPVRADAAQTAGESNYATGVLINPMFAHLISEEDIPVVVPPSSQRPAASRSDILSFKDGAASLRAQMKKRNASITVTFRSTQMDAVTAGRELFSEAFVHTGAPDEGYYLTSCYYTGSFYIYTYDDSAGRYYTVSYTLEYMTTAAQEAEMDAAVKSLLNWLDLDGKSDYEKTWIIYNYIVDHVAYDYDHMGDMEYKLQQTAYAALVHGTAVCEGYATLLFRLLLTEGVENRVQVGYAGGGLHAWNIVKMGNYWYYADSTWDDPDGWQPDYFTYFLVGEGGFTDHSRNDEYNTDVYNLLHPVPWNNYALAQGSCNQNVLWVIGNDGTLNIFGEGEMTGCSTSYTPWDSYKSRISKVEISEGITSIGEGALAWCGQLTSVTVPASVKQIGLYALSSNPALKEVTFLGDAPAINGSAFAGSVFTAYYPAGNTTWTESARSNYGGTVTWLIANGEGWIEVEDGEWMFYEDGKLVKSKWVKDGSYWCYVGSDGYMVKDKWVKDGSYWCYIGKDGHMVTDGWAKDGNVWRYMDSKGYITYSKWIHDGHGWSYVDGNGCMVTNRWMKDAGKWVYIGKDGYMVTNGWAKDGTVWRYMDKNGYITYNKWVKDSYGWGYVNASGVMVTNQWVKDGSKWCYIGADGYMVKNKWMKDGAYWVYINSNGHMVVNGWAKDGNLWRWMNSSGYITYSKWIHDGNGWCYINSKGYMEVSKWVKDGSKWCYIGADGYMATNKWLKDGNYWCYVGSDGYMVQDKWVKDGKYWAYINSSGHMVTDQWIKTNGAWSYVDGNGHALVGTHYIDGVKYTFDPSGNLIG